MTKINKISYDANVATLTNDQLRQYAFMSYYDDDDNERLEFDATPTHVLVALVQRDVVGLIDVDYDYDDDAPIAFSFDSRETRDAFAYDVAFIVVDDDLDDDVSAIMNKINNDDVRYDVVSYAIVDNQFTIQRLLDDDDDN
jgi:hypothetical protein